MSLFLVKIRKAEGETSRPLERRWEDNRLAESSKKSLKEEAKLSDREKIAMSSANKKCYNYER